jgi:D-arginine dehydrogenase
VAPVGLVPKRRTAFSSEAPAGCDISAWPLVMDAQESFYFKPDAGRIMASPGDQTPSEPQDAQPDEFDVAVLVDWLETETLVKVRRIGSSWAGLRSFVADETPVVGFDAQAEGFFWLAAQGGYGIMMAPALALATAGLILNDALPAALLEADVGKAHIGPHRIAGSLPCGAIAMPM